MTMFASRSDRVMWTDDAAWHGEIAVNLNSR